MYLDSYLHLLPQAWGGQAIETSGMNSKLGIYLFVEMFIEKGPMNRCMDSAAQTCFARKDVGIPFSRCFVAPKDLVQREACSLGFIYTRIY